ncbi:MAG: hypothetical protein P0120_06380 [Nitrospira sp.]|nr:hypothetical protein [Nitrospira sp.]
MPPTEPKKQKGNLFHNMTQAHLHAENHMVRFGHTYKPTLDLAALDKKNSAIWLALHPTEDPPQAPPPPPKPFIPNVVWDWGPIVFGNGIPVGGNAHVALYPDGSFQFSGHFHNSGFPDESVSLGVAIRANNGRLFTMATSGHMGGTITAGSRDYDWNNTGNNPDIAANWDALSEGWHLEASARASMDWTAPLDAAIEACKTYGPYIGAAIALVA